MILLRGRQYLNSVLIYGSLILLLALYSIGGQFFLKLSGGISRDFGQLMLLNAVRWLPWPFLIHLVIWLGRRFPLQGKHKVPHALAHIGGSLAVSALHPVLSWLMISITRPWWGWEGWTAGVSSYEDFFVRFLHINVITYWVVLGVQAIITYYRRSRERELNAYQLQVELARAQLMALSSQIHPHFLFNTLHTISALVYRSPKAADRMIARLSDLLRATMDHHSTQEIALRDEISILSNYIEIMKARFEEMLDIAVDIQPETLDALVPNFVLQPLLENAIRHGIMPLGKPGKIEIVSSLRDGQIILEVLDSGHGFDGDPEKLVEKGIGLRITRERLRQLYGAKASMEIGNGQSGGAQLKLVLPFHTEGQDFPGGVV